MDNENGNASEPWRTAIRRGVVTGSCASLASTLTLMALSQAETGSPWAAANATSHWLWRDQAYACNRPSLRYTGSGYAIHHAASVFWAIVQQKLAGQPRTRGQALAMGLGTAVVANFVDYLLTPKRLTPGYEARLSRKALALTYVMFGLGLVAGMKTLDGAQNPPRRRTRAIGARQRPQSSPLLSGQDL